MKKDIDEDDIKQNMDDAKLKKYEHTLAISGVAVVAFGLWSVIKAVIYFIVIPLAQVGAEFKETGDVDMEAIQSLGITDRGLGYLFAVFLMLFLLIDLLLRFLIGRSALLEGRGQKKSSLYIVLAAVMSIPLIIGIVTRAFYLSHPGETDLFQKMVDTATASMIIDLTSLFALIQVMISAIMVRRLRKELVVD